MTALLYFVKTIGIVGMSMPEFDGMVAVVETDTDEFRRGGNRREQGRVLATDRLSGVSRQIVGGGDGGVTGFEK